MTDAVVVQNLGKRFRRYHVDRPWTLHEVLLRGFRKLKPAESFWGLRDVSFTVAPGRMVGVVGRNGAGKSTLLRLIGGVGRPDEGRVNTRGRLGALLNLGAGFHPDLTGRDNLFVTGVINGLTRREVAERFDSIVAFAELESFIDNPLRTYSTGMQMRLAFAVSVHAEPEILLIDEVLSVGDLAFQRKCLDRINRFKAEGCAIILVSHEASLIRDLCDEALWLSAGRLMAHGEADMVVNQYVAETKAEIQKRLEDETRRRARAARPVLRTSHGTELIINENRFGSFELEITQVRLLDSQGAYTEELVGGSYLRIEVDYIAHQPIIAPVFQIQILRADRLVCFDLNTEATELKLATIQGSGRIALDLERLDLNSGTYYVDVGAYAQDWSYAYDYHSNVYPLVIHGDGSKAVIYSPHRWDLSGRQATRTRMERLRAK
jgi:lipopolysaccharide transport system ATP-binding protein